jgi:serine/threonine protein kinase
MNPLSWERVKLLFAQALSLDSPSRARFLDSVTADPEERSMIEYLLREHDEAGSFLERPALEALSQSPVRRLPAGPSAPHDVPEGTILRQRYVIERELGRGGNGIVYLARDSQLSSRPVVVKLLHSTVLDSSWRARFRTEIEALARINRPGVIGVLDICDEPGQPPLLVMEYVDGVTLRSILSDGGLPLSRIAGILIQIGEALAAAHESGVAHRDLKPENIMIQKSRQGTDIVRLIDFGIAKVEESKVDQHTTNLILVGTTRYMAPEQILGRASYTTDIYALGVVAYEMLTGRCPFEASSAFDLLDMQFRKHLTRPRKMRPDLPVKAERLILSSLVFHPHDRPQDVDSFARNLAAALLGGSGAARKVAAIAAVLLLVVALGARTLRWVPSGLTDPAIVRVLEKKNSTDPLSEGFTTLHDESNNISGMVSLNPSNSGYDGWRVTTTRQGFYTRTLTEEQEAAALARGWKMSAVSRVETGGAFVIASFSRSHRRFDIFTFRDGNGATVVRVITKLLPSLEGPEYRLEGSDASFHNFNLVYDAKSHAADLWVDGTRRLSGYSGHTEYAEHSWFTFGPHVYGSPRAMATFQTLRFEINP